MEDNIEIERKYEVATDAELPADFSAAGLTAAAPVAAELEAAYFDTADGALAANRLAMRRRSGGHDAGWHLKERGEHGVREQHWPLTDEVPVEVLAEISSRIGRPVAGPEELTTIARIVTARTMVVLSDASGGSVVELADDRVRAEDGQGVRRAWREWEAELLGDADPAALGRVEPLLLAAGATPSPSPAKIARATGRLVEMARAGGADAVRIVELERIETSDIAAASAG